MHQLLKPLRSLTNATVLAEPRTLSGDGLKRSRLRVGKLPSQAGNRAVWSETRHELHSEQMRRLASLVGGPYTSHPHDRLCASGYSNTHNT